MKEFINTQENPYFDPEQEAINNRVEATGGIPARDVRDEFKKCQEDFVYWFETYYQPIKYKK